MQRTKYNLKNGSIIIFGNTNSIEGMDIIIPSVDSEQIIPKVKIYEPNGITYWSNEIGFNKFTDPNRKQ